MAKLKHIKGKSKVGIMELPINVGWIAKSSVVKKISKETKILNCLQKKKKQRGVIAQETGIAKTTCYKYLKRLQSKGKVFRVKERKRGQHRPRIFWSIEKPKTRLSLKQEKILGALQQDQGLTISEIIKKTDIAKTTCYDNLAELKSKGLIKKENKERNKPGHPEVIWFLTTTQ